MLVYTLSVVANWSALGPLLVYSDVVVLAFVIVREEVLLR